MQARQRTLINRGGMVFTEGLSVVNQHEKLPAQFQEFMNKFLLTVSGLDFNSVPSEISCIVEAVNPLTTKVRMELGTKILSVSWPISETRSAYTRFKPGRDRVTAVRIFYGTKSRKEDSHTHTMQLVQGSDANNFLRSYLDYIYAYFLDAYCSKQSEKELEIIKTQSEKAEN